MQPMNGHSRHGRVRTAILGYAQGPQQSTPPKEEPENYPFILTNWIRDKADSRQEEIKLTYLAADDKDHQGKVATRWVHQNRPVLTFDDFKTLVDSNLKDDPEGRFAAQRCLTEVERLHQKRFVHGKFIDAVTYQYPPPEAVPHVVESDSMVTARFVCFPLFALYPPQTVEGHDLHPPRAMAQYFYKLEDTRERDARQAIRELDKLRQRKKRKKDCGGDIVHVFHLWAMTIKNSITITAAPLNTKALLGQNIRLEKHDDSYRTLGASIRYTDRKKKQYFFPLKECKMWKHLIKKIGDVTDDSSGRQSDADIILNPQSEYSLVDENHFIVDKARWSKLTNDSSIHQLVTLQLHLTAFARYDDDSEDELDETTLSPKEKQNMDDHVVAKWILTHRQLALKHLKDEYARTSDEDVKRTLGTKIESATHSAKAALRSTRRLQLASKLLAGAERYRALSVQDPAESVASAMTPSLENSEDPFAFAPESHSWDRPETGLAMIRDLMSWLHEMNHAGHASSSHEGYYPRSNCHVSSKKPYRALPGSQQISTSNNMGQNFHTASTIHEISTPFTLRPVGMRNEEHYYHQDRIAHLNSPYASADRGANAIVNQQPRHLRHSSAPHELRSFARSPISRPSSQKGILHDDAASSGSNDARLTRENSHGLSSAKDDHRVHHRKRRRKGHKLFGASGLYTPILEWPVDGADPKLEDILQDLHQKFERSIGTHQTTTDAKADHQSGQEDMRETCFKLVESLEERSGTRKSKAAQAKRSLVTTAGDLIDCYVPDHFRAPLVDQYWTLIHRLCEASYDWRLETVEDPTSRGINQQSRPPSVITFVQDTSWKFYKRIEGILKSVQTPLTGRTLPYSVPQPLIDSFHCLINFYLLSTQTHKQSTLDAAIQQVFHHLEKAEHELPNMADESEDSIFNCIGFQHVDAHALLSLVLENCLKVCSVDMNSNKEYEAVCFDMVNVYDEYVTRIHSQARDNADLKVYEKIKLVSEELSIIKSVQSIQWQIAAAFENMTSDRPSILERRVKSRIFEHIAQSMEHFDELMDRVKDARIDATQSIAVHTELNNKAILIFTTVATIFLPLTFVSGLLSMNTKDTTNIPDGQWLFWSIALPLTLGIMISALSFVYFGSLVPTANRLKEKVSRIIHGLDY